MAKYGPREGSSNYTGKRKEVARIRQEARFYGDPLDDDLNPADVMMYGLKTSYAICKYLEAKIGEWADLDLDTGLVSLQEDIPGAGGGYTRVTKDQELWLKAYRDERKLMMATAKMCVEMGLSERQMKLAEQQASLMFDVVTQMVDALGLSADQQRMVPKLLPTIIRSIAIEA